MKALIIQRPAQEASEVHLELVERPKPVPNRGQCLVEVGASGVNQSDAKATLGFFSRAQWPRIVGRDFAGKVGQKRVWGTCGAMGIESDGVQAEWVALDEGSLAEMPKGWSMEEAGGSALPYVTAWMGLKKAQVKKGEKVLVIGALGQVGQAAMALCHWLKAEPIAYVKEDRLAEAKKRGWEATTSFPEVDVIMNPIANLLWEEPLKKLKPFGRMVVFGIASKKNVELDLLSLYRANHSILGINSTDIDPVSSAHLLQEMKEGFDAKKLPPLGPMKVFSLEEASKAYRAVLEGATDRIVIRIRENH
jgi:NADPH:quinone reductase-like Zn-dependent oxidoreductase